MLTSTNTINNSTATIYYAVDNAEVRREQLLINISTLKEKQLCAFNTINKYLLGSAAEKKMLMFVSGEGGTGKSRLIELVAENARLLFGKTKGLYGSVLIMAPTGTAANGISGFTWQSVLKKSKFGSKVKSNNKKSQIIGQNLRGVKLIIIDEISMISYESIYDISETIKAALLTTCDEEDEESRKFITNNPFGGVHILFTGDLYQLKPIGGTPIFSSRESDKITCTRGRAIWHSMTDYIELTEACRYLDGNDSVLAKFLTAARKGIVHEDILVTINERYKMSVDETISLANEKAIWMANTKKEVEKINNMCFDNLTKNGKLSYRIVAEHIPSKALIPFPNEQTKEELYKYEDDNSPSYIDLAIGSRVSINKNLATQIGCYNGALGTVRGSNTIKNVNYCK